MVNTLLEVGGIALVLTALVIFAVVAGSFRWEAGAVVAGVEAAGVGALLIVLANRRPASTPAGKS